MNPSGAVLTPDHRAVLEHLEGAEFLEGVARGWWKLTLFAWPYMYVAVAAAPRADSREAVVLRMDLNGYPQEAPTSTPWDPDTASVLSAAKRPRGEFVSHVFRTDWMEGQALYAPYDRVAINGHLSWEVQHAADLWNPTRNFAFVLLRVHQLLNDDDYEGCA